MTKARKRHIGTGNLPVSLEAEKAVIGGAIKQKEGLSLLIGKCDELDFFSPPNQVLFQELETFHNAQKSIDLVTFTQHLSDFNLLEKVGGPAYVTECYTSAAFDEALMDEYITILKDKSLLRKIYTIGQNAAERSQFEQGEVDEILTDLQITVGELKKYKHVEPHTLADDVDEKLERLQSGTPDSDVVKMYIKQLDLLSPLRMGGMPLITGETKSGKSILATTILENVCISQKRPGVYFSLEDRRPVVMDRIMAGVSKVPMAKDHVSKLTQEEMDRLAKASEHIRSSGLIVHDDCFELNTIISTAKQELVKHPDLAIIVIDYVQLISMPTKKETSKELEVAAISRAFRIFAMETGVPIVLLAQLNEQGQTRYSRALQQDCTAKWNITLDEEDPMHKRLITIELQRNGPMGVSFPVTFMGEIARVENFHSDDPLDK